uniref:26S proteasome non-ATPase regulatory subunit 14 n=1 Tax=Ascaris suum TaxID=6253 RepID=F1L9A2_ASCSU
MDRLLRLSGFPNFISRATPEDVLRHPDTSETVYISSLALLKMLRHGRAGVPMEVMGLMLGEFVDDYTVNVVDVFAMPQSGTGVSVEAVDPVYQTKMLDMLNRVCRTEMVVGWYHSHPGFGCWLSSVDVATQKSFEALSERAIAVVVDPIQSVKGKVVIDAFRTIGMQAMDIGFPEGAQKTFTPTEESRQTTSNLGHLVKHTIVEALHGLGRTYYSVTISFKPTPQEQKMLQCLHQMNWAEGLMHDEYAEVAKRNHENMLEMVKLIKLYTKEVANEETEKDLKSKEELEVNKIGRLNPKRRLEETAQSMMTENIVHEMAGLINANAFQ